MAPPEGPQAGVHFAQQQNSSTIVAAWRTEKLKDFMLLLWTEIVAYHMENFIPVSGDVLFTDGIGLEGFLTIRTQERPAFTVTRHVTIERPFCWKETTAFRTLEIPTLVLLVGSVVSPQHTFRHKIPIVYKNILEITTPEMLRVDILVLYTNRLHFSHSIR